MPLFRANSATRALVAEEADTENFKIHKPARFGNRCFQIITSLGAWFFLGSQNEALLYSHGAAGFFSLNIALSVLSPMASVVCIIIYVIPWFKKKWTSRKLLKVEGVVDLIFTMFWILLFAAEMHAIGDSCPPGRSAACDKYNWVLAWGCLSGLFWFVAFCLDLWSYLDGVYNWGDRLGEQETDTVLRRLAQKTRGGGRGIPQRI
ncbi:MAG: hypothetical protein SGCHY_002412 [Lobulomycetales sp.]